MSKLIPFCGLPRTGSTLLCNILGQHPDVTLSADSVLSDKIVNIMNYTEKLVAESQYDADLTYKLHGDFLMSGIDSWISNLSDTKFYVDKCRGWGNIFNFIFEKYPDTKIIFTIRDLRGVYLSFDRLSTTSVLLNSLSDHYRDLTEKNEEVDFLNARISHFLNGDMVKPHLINLKEIIELDRHYLDNIKIVRYEDFMKSPDRVLSDICNFTGMDNYKFDLNNITQVNYNDSIYLPYGYHKLRKTLTPNIPNYDNKLRKSAQEKIFSDFEWYYSIFYPEVLR